MEKLAKFLDKYIFLIVFLVSVPAIWALLVPGFFGASDEVHIAWLYEMSETFKLGQIPPRFVPDLSFRFGYPLFNFVFPLPYYFGSVFHSLGFSLVDSVKLVFLLSFPLSAYFMYKLLRTFSDPYLSFIGALIYIYTPYRATDIYVRGAIGEVVSFVFLPLILLAFTKLTGGIDSKKLKFKWVAIAAVSIASLILSHNITSYMFLPVALVYAGIRLFTLGRSKKVVLPFITACLMGLLLSVYFWLPALVESNFMKYDTVFNFWDHFPSLRQLATPYFGYGASVPGPGDGISFFIGLANIAIGLIAVAIVIFKSKKFESPDKIILLWALSITLLSIFMMNHRSTFFWQTLPFLPYFQFPWRFLTLVSFVTPLMVISLKYIRKEVGLLLIFLVLFTFPYFRPQDFLMRGDDYFLAKYIPYPEVKAEYLTQAEEYLRLPSVADKRPSSWWPGIHTRQKDGLEMIVNPVEKRLGIDAKILTTSDVVLNYGKYYFPGWVVEDNGTKIEVYGSPPYGEITFMLKGAGEHLVKIYFQETPFRLILNIISLSALIVSVIIYLKSSLRILLPKK